MKELTNEERKALWMRYLRYRWEFTRRNKEYQQDYGYLKKYNDEEYDDYLLEMGRKWGFALDPNNDSPDFSLVSISHPFPGNLGLKFFPIMRFLGDDGAVTIGSDKQHYKILGEIQPHSIIIEINYEEMPDWLTLASIENLIKAIRSHYGVKEKRIPWEQLEDYLKIYDLNQQRVSHEEIAKQVFLKDLDDKEDDIEDELESAIRNVRRCLKKAKEMIARGQIT